MDSRSSDGSEARASQRQLDTDQPSVEVASVVAELEGTDPTDLSAIHTTVDDVLRHIFDNPPAPEAQVETSFSYEGYRITIHQDGAARFLKVG